MVGFGVTTNKAVIAAVLSPSRFDSIEFLKWDSFRKSQLSLEALWLVLIRESR